MKRTNESFSAATPGYNYNLGESPGSIIRSPNNVNKRSSGSFTFLTSHHHPFFGGFIGNSNSPYTSYVTSPYLPPEYPLLRKVLE